jgi:hypothetical protein
VYSTEVNGFSKCTFLFVLDVNLLKIVLTTVVNSFANVAPVKHKYFFKRFPHADVF